MFEPKKPCTPFARLTPEQLEQQIETTRELSEADARLAQILDEVGNDRRQSEPETVGTMPQH